VRIANHRLASIGALLIASVCLGCAAGVISSEEAGKRDRAAIAKATAAIKRNPANAIAYSNRSVARYRIGDHQGAIEDASKAIELTPDDAVAYQNRAAAEYALKDIKSAASDARRALELDPQLEPARQLLNAAQGGFPDSPSQTLTELDQAARDFYQEGQLRQSEGDYKGARDMFSKLIALGPNYYMSEAYMYRANLALRLGDLQGAEDDYSMSIDLHMKGSSLNRHIQVVFYNRGLMRLQHEDRVGAIEDFSTALELDPDLLMAYIGRAGARRASGDYSGARQDYDKVLQHNPNLAVALIGRAEVDGAIGAFESALKDLNRAAELQPIMYVAYWQRARLKQFVGDLEGALVDYGQAVELASKFDRGEAVFGEISAYVSDSPIGAARAEWGHSQLGKDALIGTLSDRSLLRRDVGDIVGGLADYRYLLTTEPQTHYGRAWRSIARSQWCDDVGALGDIDSAIQLHRGNSWLYFVRGGVKAESGDNLGAMEDYSESMKLLPSVHWKAQVNRAAVRMKLGDLSGAADDLAQALRLNSQFAPGYVELAVLQAVLGHEEEASAAAKRALLINPRLATVYVQRAVNERRFGRYVAAIASGTRAVTLAPDSAQAYFARGAARLSVNDAEGARQDFERAKRLNPRLAEQIDRMVAEGPEPCLTAYPGDSTKVDSVSCVCSSIERVSVR
jgi:tetratricopeptide (TPR) repeat protein